MGILRAECNGICNKNEDRSTYDAIVADVQDLTDPETETWSVGSMALVMSDGKVYTKVEDGSWRQI